MTLTIINHPRKQVEFGSYSGLAGVAEENGIFTISFPARRRDFRDLRSGSVDGKTVQVLSIEDSAKVKGAVLIKAKAG